MTSVTCTSRLYSRSTRVAISTARSSQPTIRATTTHMHVLITTPADSATRTSDVTRFLATPAIFTAATTNRQQDGKFTLSNSVLCYTVGCWPTGLSFMFSTDKCVPGDCCSRLLSRVSMLVHANPSVCCPVRAPGLKE